MQMELQLVLVLLILVIQRESSMGGMMGILIIIRVNSIRSERLYRELQKTI